MYFSLLETNKSEQKYTNIKPHKPNTAGCVRLIDVSWQVRAAVKSPDRAPTRRDRRYRRGAAAEILALWREDPAQMNA
jgi:hypothetical protein